MLVTIELSHKNFLPQAFPATRPSCNNRIPPLFGRETVGLPECNLDRDVDCGFYHRHPVGGGMWFDREVESGFIIVIPLETM